MHLALPDYFLTMNTSAKTRTQIAAEYGISPRTLSRWLKRRDIRLSRGLLGPKEQALIYQVLGRPKQDV
ncbi:MAG: hypothetical protein OHK0039_35970 [Bacteroidia bacterium]